MKHPDWKHHKSALFVQKPGQEGSTASDKIHQNITGTIDGAQRILKQLPLQPVCSPCCCQCTQDTEVSAAIPPDYRAASFPRLWDSWTHPQHQHLTLHELEVAGLKINILFVCFFKLLFTLYCGKARPFYSFCIRRQKHRLPLRSWFVHNN